MKKYDVVVEKRHAHSIVISCEKVKILYKRKEEIQKNDVLYRYKKMLQSILLN